MPLDALLKAEPLQTVIKAEFCRVSATETRFALALIGARLNRKNFAALDTDSLEGPTL
jgi:hypothetical protein